MRTHRGDSGLEEVKFSVVEGRYLAILLLLSGQRVLLVGFKVHVLWLSNSTVKEVLRGNLTESTTLVTELDHGWPSDGSLTCRATNTEHEGPWRRIWTKLEVGRPT